MLLLLSFFASRVCSEYHRDGESRRFVFITHRLVGAALAQVQGGVVGNFATPIMELTHDWFAGVGGNKHPRGRYGFYLLKTLILTLMLHTHLWGSWRKEEGFSPGRLGSLMV